MRKVVVTGMGAVTSIGATMPAFWDGLVSGKCGMKKIERMSVEEHETTVAAEVDEAYQTEISKYNQMKGLCIMKTFRKQSRQSRPLPELRKNRFTLIELLVVIAIIAILAGMLLHS